MKKRFAILLYLISNILWADAQWECQESLMAYTAKLNEIQISKNTEEAIRFYQSVSDIVTLCARFGFDNDFDIDGVDIYGLRHLKSYAKILAEGKEINYENVAPVTDEGGVRLVAWDPVEKQATFEFTDYGENYQKQIVLSDNSPAADFKNQIGNTARILYDLSSGVLKEVIFDDNNKHEVSTTQESETYEPTSDYTSKMQIQPEPVSQNETDNTHSPKTQVDHPYAQSDNRFYLYIFGGLFVVGLFMGMGDNRTIIVFRDYDDLGLTFLLPVSVAVSMIVILAISDGEPSRASVLLGMVPPVYLLGKLIKETYVDNRRSALYAFFALLVKVPLGLLWVLNLVSLLNPHGKTAKERRSNRTASLILLAMLTPIIGLLVAKKEGSLFNPKSWLRGKRIGQIRTHL